MHLLRRQSRRAVRQGREEDKAGDDERIHDHEREHHPLADDGAAAWPPPRSDVRDRNWVVDRVAAEEERKDDAGDEGGDEVGGEVMVQEELARHGEERKVVVQPSDEEEPASVVQAVPHGCTGSR